MNRTTTCIAVLWIALALILAGLCGCSDSQDQRAVGAAFARYVQILQHEDLEEIDLLIHPESPLLQAVVSRELRTRLWKVQRLRLSMLNGQIEVLNITKTALGRQLTYRFTSDEPMIPQVQSTVDFQQENGVWRMVVPENGLDIVPIDFSRLQFDQVFTQETETGHKMGFHVSGQTTAGISKEEWKKILQEQGDAPGGSPPENSED